MLGSLLALSTLAAGEPAPDTILARMFDSLGQIQTLSGWMERTVQMGRDSSLRMAGRFYYKFPDRLRVNISIPELQEVVLTGRRVMSYKLKEKEYTVKELSGLSDPSGFWALGSEPLKELSDRLIFKFIWAGQVEEYRVYLLEGRPREPDSSLSKFLIWVDQERFLPLRYETYRGGEYPNLIYLVDSLSLSADRYWIPIEHRLFLGVDGGFTIIRTRLRALRINEPIPDSVFVLPIPGLDPGHLDKGKLPD